MRPPTPTALAVTGLLAGTLLTAPGLAGTASAADLATCQGRAVTQVVTSGPATATAGDDVVVVDVPTGAGGFSLTTGDGDDVVCAHGSAALVIDTGAGADAVDLSTMSLTAAPSQVTLGLGDDRFVGGPSGEVVTDSAGGLLGSPTAPGIDDDTITTGGGDDRVSSLRGADTISTGAGNDLVPLLVGPEADRVDLGDGDDGVTLTAARTTALLGGAGTDTLTAVAFGDTGAIDNAAQLMTLGGLTAGFDSFESFVAEVPRSFTFRGSDRPERLQAVRVLVGSAAPLGTRQLTADMAGGDDQLVVDQAMTGLWRGGPGTDLVATDRNEQRASRGRQPDLVVDLLKGRLDARGTPGASIGAFERLATTRYPNVTVLGSKGADEVSLSTCRAFVDGRQGRDVIDVDNGPCGDKPRTSTLRGGGGADRITGASGADTMWGGSGADVLRGRGGRDVAHGGPGRDRCTAERRTSC
jgi:Ca2+-binding RTX toxin-like protein